MDKGIWIYALDCPLSYQVRYVGKSKDPKKRFKTHLQAADTVTLRNWVDELKQQGLKPSICYLERVPQEKSSEAESRWINLLLEHGHNLINKSYRGAKRTPASPVPTGQRNGAGQSFIKEGCQSLSEAAKRIGVSYPWASELCQKNRWPGAMKIGSRWNIPTDTIPLRHPRGRPR